MDKPVGIGIEDPYGGALFDPALLDIVPSKVATSNRILPVGMSGNVLVCYAEDADDPYLLSRLRFQLRREVRLIPSGPGFVAAMREAYGGDPCPETEDLVDAVSDPAPVGLRVPKPQPHRPWTAAPKVIAITSGKGGVGKTTLSTNIGIALAGLGLNVGLVDCDFGLSNLHVVMGVRPRHKLPDVLQGRVSLAESFETAPGGVSVLAGATGSSEMAELSYWQLHKGGVSTENLRKLFDVAILDTGAGIQRSVVSVLSHADEAILVVTPDPSSVQDAYVTMRVLLERKPDARIGFVVNGVRDIAQANDVMLKFQTFASLHLGTHPRFLGSVSHDRAVQRATRSRVPVLLSHPNAKASKEIRTLAQRFSGVTEPSGLRNFIERLRSA